MSIFKVLIFNSILLTGILAFMTLFSSPALSAAGPVDMIMNPGEYQGITGLLKFIGLLEDSGLLPNTLTESRTGTVGTGSNAQAVTDGTGANATTMAGAGPETPGRLRAVVLPVTGSDASWAAAIEKNAVISLESMGIGPVSGPGVLRILKEAGMSARGPFGLEEFEEIEEARDCDLIIAIEVSNQAESSGVDLRGFLKNPGSMGKSRRITAQIFACVFIPMRGTFYRLKPVRIDSRFAADKSRGLERALIPGIRELLGTKIGR